MAPSAWAGDWVLVVGDERIERRFDPHLEPDRERLEPGPPPARPAGPSVRQALDAARRRGAISRSRHARYLATYEEALQARRNRGEYRGAQVHERCRAQIGRVLGILGGIAARGQLTPARMRPLFLQLGRNVEFWTREPRVRIGERVSFGKDPLLLQHYKGYGLQIQPLGNAGKANGLWNQCKDTPEKCREKTLRGLLDGLVRISSWRAGARAWEYWFPFGGGSPPWASGMAQATAMQALARGSLLFGEPRFMLAAEKGLGLFSKRTPAGVSVKAKKGTHYALYSFAPGLRVLNAYLQTITGLYDFWKLNGSRRARDLFRRGDRFARRHAPKYDTGRWSYYALPNKNLSSMDYHVLVTGFLENLCERTGRRVYCKLAKRFNKYLDRRGGPPPPGGTPPAPGPRCGYL